MLAEFADHLRRRRAALLDAWRARVLADPALTTADRLTRRQFTDHIPSALDALDRALRQRDPAALSAEGDGAAGEHGAHRWQQGYSLEEVVRESGHLHLCLLCEISEFARLRAAAPQDIECAHEVVARMLHGAVSASVGRYHELQRSEAAGRVNALEAAVAQFGLGEKARGNALRAASHDLRGGLSIVAMSAALLQMRDVGDAQRSAAMERLQRGLASLAAMLEELADLSRLEAGQECCSISRFDAARLLNDMCNASRALALDKGLALNADGPAPLVVEGDAGHLRRLAQNLLINAIKYTAAGRVEVRWELHGQAAWRFVVADTGPGLPSGAAAAPLLDELKATTDAAHSVEGDSVRIDDAGRQQAAPPAPGTKGEGIGLAIVKRLCELLDAGLEVDSEPGRGTTFRVTLPIRYAPAPEAGAS